MNRTRALLAVAAAVAWFFLQSFSVMNDAPPASPDAAVFADAAHNLASGGHPGTNLAVGMTHHLYWQPPGYMLALAATFKVFGYGLLQLRLLSLVFGAACIGMVYALSVKIHADRLTALIAVIVLSFDPLFSKWARWDRMDTLCMFFVLLSLFLYVKASERKRFLVLAGASASAAMLIHPYGAIALAAIAVHAILVRRPSGRELVAFFLPLLLLFGGWLIYIAQAPGEFLVQMRYQISRKLTSFPASSTGIFSQYRFFPVYSVIVMEALVFAYWSRRKPFIPADLLLAIAVLMVICSYVLIKGPYYHAYLAPIMAMAASVVLARGMKSERRGIRRVAAVLLAMFLLNSVLYAASMTWLYKWNLKQEASHAVLVHRVLQYIPGHARFGHFGYPTPYWVLQSLGESDRLREMYFLHPGSEDEVFNGLDYLVFTQSSNPATDNQGTRRDIDFCDAVLEREGRRLRFVAFVGTDAANAYRAVIYSIEGGDNYADGGQGPHLQMPADKVRP